MLIRFPSVFILMFSAGAGGDNPTAIQKSVNAMLQASNGMMSSYRDPVLAMADMKRKEAKRAEDAKTDSSTAALMNVADTSAKEDDEQKHLGKEGSQVKQKSGGWYSAEGTQKVIPQAPTCRVPFVLSCR
jgi:hypothetical protein